MTNTARDRGRESEGLRAPTAARRVLRARIAWWTIALIGLVFVIGPVFTYSSLSAQHIAAHLLTGPAMIGLAMLQLRQLRAGATGYRSLDWLLAGFGLWLIALPFTIPAAGLHIHGHAVAGAVATVAALWNAISLPDSRRAGCSASCC